MSDKLLDFPPGVEARLRRDLRSQILTAGVPSQYADQIVDIAFHASSSAMQAMTSVLHRLDHGPSYQCAMGIAAGLVKNRAGFVEDALKAFAATTGAQATTIELSAGGADA